MDAARRELTLHDYGRVIVTRKWVVVAATLAAVAVSLLVSFLTDPTYEASAGIQIDPRSDPELLGQGGVAGSNDERVIGTAVQVIESGRVRQRVSETLGLDRLPPEVSARAVADTNVVYLTVRSEDPETAAILADAYADAYIVERGQALADATSAAKDELDARIETLEAQAADLDPFSAGYDAVQSQLTSFREARDELDLAAAVGVTDTSVIDSAEIPTDPAEPRPVRNALLAAAAGLTIGVVAAFVLEFLDDSVESEGDLRTISDLPMLAAVPALRAPGAQPAVMIKSTPQAAERYRALCTRLGILDPTGSIRVIQMTSPAGSDGKTTTVGNVAAALAESGARVVVVDGDQRNPGVHRMFGVPQSPGVSDYVLGKPIDDILQSLAIDDATELTLVTSGEVSAYPGATMSNPRMSALLGELRERFDYVLVDSARVLPVADSVVLARVVDGVVLVVDAESTSTGDVSETLRQLGRVSAPLIGFVLNRTDD